MSAWGGRESKGFTLIEMLIVVAIIAILAALLSPSLRTAMRRARQAVCVNNLHQCFLGLSAYADDSRNRVKIRQLLPSDGGSGGHLDLWPQFVTGYARFGRNEADCNNAGGTAYIPLGSEVLDCPDRPRNPGRGKLGTNNHAYAMLANYGNQNNGKGWRFMTYWSGHTGNESVDAPGEALGWGGKGGTCYLIRVNKVPSPARMIFLGDSVSSGPDAGFYNHRHGDNFDTASTFSPSGNGDWETRLWFHHPGRMADLLFFDGSVRAMSPFDANETDLNVRHVFDEDGSPLDFPN